MKSCIWHHHLLVKLWDVVNDEAYAGPSESGDTSSRGPAESGEASFGGPSDFGNASVTGSSEGDIASDMSRNLSPIEPHNPGSNEGVDTSHSTAVQAQVILPRGCCTPTGSPSSGVPAVSRTKSIH